MVSVLTQSAVDHRFKPLSGQTKDYKIGICCFSAKHAGEQVKTGWLGIGIMFPSGATNGKWLSRFHPDKCKVLSAGK